MRIKRHFVKIIAEYGKLTNPTIVTPCSECKDIILAHDTAFRDKATKKIICKGCFKKRMDFL